MPKAETSRPIAIFDSGIGSFAFVQAVQARFPSADIVYLADRASFPYGAKTPAELLACCARAIGFFKQFGPAAIVVASNAPSVTILPELALNEDLPLIGVFPPIKRALKVSRGKAVVVAGVSSMVQSTQAKAYVALEAGADLDRVHLRDASGLVSLVESGLFLTDEVAVQLQVDNWIGECSKSAGPIGVLTYSSTHLSFLGRYFIKHRTIEFLDPVEDVVESLRCHIQPGKGARIFFATSTPELPVVDLQRMLASLGDATPLTEVRDLGRTRIA